MNSDFFFAQLSYEISLSAPISINDPTFLHREKENHLDNYLQLQHEQRRLQNTAVRWQWITRTNGTHPKTSQLSNTEQPVQEIKYHII